MLPEMQDSPYDYIIFEMPSVEKSGRTLTMAALMDKVVLVLDAENTIKDMLVWTYSELTKGKADVSCVFNKARSDVPSWLCAN
jgi:Mrp family chromosome partitioning ATPase